LIRLLISGIIFYIIYKIIKLFSKVSASIEKQKTNNFRQYKNADTNVKTRIDKKDIVDAEFVEIKTEKRSNN